MKLSARDVKDKRIVKAGLAYVAEVHLYGGVIGAGRHLTLVSAQRALAKYPAGIYEGNDDPAKARRRDKKRGLNLRPFQRPKRLYDDYVRLIDRWR